MKRGNDELHGLLGYGVPERTIAEHGTRAKVSRQLALAAVGGIFVLLFIFFKRSQTSQRQRSSSHLFLLLVAQLLEAQAMRRLHDVETDLDHLAFLSPYSAR